MPAVSFSSCALTFLLERMMKVEWSSGKGSSGEFSASLQLEAIDRQGLLAELTGVFSEQKLNVVVAAVRAHRQNIVLLLAEYAS